MTKKICILLHIGYCELWDEMINYIDNVMSCDEKVDLFINLIDDINLNDSNFIEKIKKEYPNVIITYSENKGMDIGGFLTQMKYILENNLEYDYLIKLHTKKKRKWRKELFDPIVGGLGAVKKCLRIFKKNNKIGLIGSAKWYLHMDHFNSIVLLKLLNEFGIKNNYIDEIDWDKKNEYSLDPYFYLTYPSNRFKVIQTVLDSEEWTKKYAERHWKIAGSKVHYLIQNKQLIKKKVDDLHFIGGTIFWMRFDILKKFIIKYINIDDHINRLEYGYIKNDKPTLTHSYERLFSIIVANSNYELIGI